MPFIYILPIETDFKKWLDPMKKGILEAFGFEARLLHKEIDLKAAYDKTRNQYNSSRILIQIISMPPVDACKIIGVVDVDLFIPILTFVFGEAQLNGIGSVVSSHRLDNRFYGLPKDDELYTLRLIKETIHELGHTFGLFHCPNQDCVMKSSTYVENIDQKYLEMCSECLDSIRKR